MCRLFCPPHNDKYQVFQHFHFPSQCTLHLGSCSLLPIEKMKESHALNYCLLTLTIQSKLVLINNHLINPFWSCSNPGTILWQRAWYIFFGWFPCCSCCHWYCVCYRWHKTLDYRLQLWWAGTRWVHISQVFLAYESSKASYCSNFSANVSGLC